jgi:C4-dicarboxylate-specific signal transduction histidine kinase
VTVLAAVVFVVAVAVLVYVHRRTQRGLSERLVERQKMMDKQQKVIVRESKRTLLRAEEALALAEHVREDTRAIHAQTQAMLRSARTERHGAG